jgi:hypothetical protein
MMSMLSPIAPQPALAALAGGIRAAGRHFDQAADDVAANGPGIDGMVGMLEARLDTQACAQGFRVASDTEGALIDVLA